MFATGAVAAFALDAEAEAGGVVFIGRRGEGLEVAAVALEAARIDRAIEADTAVFVAGAIDPLAGCDPPGDGQLEEQVVFPIEVGLRFMAGADDDVEALGEFYVLAGRDFVDGGLVKSVGIGGHFEVKRGVGGLEDVAAGSEASRDGVRIGGARG